MIKTAVGFTGHRPQMLGGYDEDNFTARWVKSALNHVFTRLIRLGYDTFITGGALGFDTWAAETVLMLRNCHVPAKLWLYSPFPSQAARWPAHAKSRYSRIVAQADLIRQVSRDPYDVKKMFVRNRAIVDDCALLVACFDQTQQTGGTRDCLMYAIDRNRPIVLIDPKKREVFSRVAQNEA